MVEEVREEPETTGKDELAQNLIKNIPADVISTVAKFLPNAEKVRLS